MTISYRKLVYLECFHTHIVVLGLSEENSIGQSATCPRQFKDEIDKRESW